MEHRFVSFSPSFGLSVADDPVQKLAGPRLDQTVRANSQEIQHHRHHKRHSSGGDGEIEQTGVCEQSASSQKTEFRNGEVVVESAIVVGGNVWVDVFIQIDFVLSDLSDGLFLS